MLKGNLSVPAPINPYDIKADVFMPVDLIDKVVRRPDDQLPLFVIHEFLGIAEAGTATELNFHKHQKTLMLHDQVNFRMLVAIIGAQEFIALGL